MPTIGATVPAAPIDVVGAARSATAERAALPSKDFGLPEKAKPAKAKNAPGNYPVPDRGHPISAKRLAEKNHETGNLSDDEFERINRKADKKLKNT